jgi:hypothetical protein
MPAITPEAIEAWLAALGVVPGVRVEREGLAAWDLTLDGRVRRDLRVTLILDPTIGAIVWAHLAPPLLDGLRKSYRTLLRWNDEFPLVKFSIADDGRPTAAVEIPTRWLDADELGLALARVAGVADRVFEETRGWLWIGSRVPDGYAEREIRNLALLDRFSAQLGELVAAAPAEDADAPSASEAPEGAALQARAPGARRS